MGLVVVVVAVVVVYLLWRLVKANETRAQVEVARMVIERTETVTKAFQEKFAIAQRDGHLIEYLDEAARTFQLSDDQVKVALLSSANRENRRALVIESVRRSKSCRFLDEGDYEQFAPGAPHAPAATPAAPTPFSQAEIERAWRVGYPGPMPKRDLMCSDCCEATEAVTYMPDDAKTCPFCGAPTKPMMDDEFHRKELVRWRDEDRAWQLWKLRSPAEAKKDQREQDERDARHLAEDRAEFEAALAAKARPDID